VPFIRRHEIKSSVRKPHEGAYKGQLRQALTNPGLSAEQRERIKSQLAEVGQAKVYRVDTPPKPGAISFEEPLPPRKILETLKRVDLLVIARKLKIPTNGSKAEIVERLLLATHNGG